jgi:hypothetical protein
MGLNLRRHDLSSFKRVMLAGEGPNELGGWATEVAYRDTSYPGILEVLLLATEPHGWRVAEAKRWKDIKKYRAGEHRSAEHRNVLAVCLDAKEKGCQVVAFSRDSDGDSERKVRIEQGIQAAKALWGAHIGIVGGCAVPCVEGWVLAIQGVPHTEQSSRKKLRDRLSRLGTSPKSTTEMVESIKRAGLANIANDARSLKSWLQSASVALER